MSTCNLECIAASGYSFDTMCLYSQIHCSQNMFNFIQAYFCIFKNSFLVLILIGVLIFYL